MFFYRIKLEQNRKKIFFSFQANAFLIQYLFVLLHLHNLLGASYDNLRNASHNQRSNNQQNSVYMEKVGKPAKQVSLRARWLSRGLSKGTFKSKSKNDNNNSSKEIVGIS